MYDRINHGTVHGGAKWVKGGIGGALEFDGKNDFVDLSATTVAVQGNAPRTIACWVRTTGRGPRNVVATGAPAGWQAFNLQMNNGIVRVMGFSHDFYPRTGRRVNDGAWHHIAAVYDGAGTVRTYVDGAEDNSGSFSYSTTRQNNFIGKSNHRGHEFWFSGGIDDLRVYDRVLSPEEVGMLYGMGSQAGPGSRPGG